MVVSQEAIASKIGVDVLRAGGNAIDAAVATAFALAVVHPTAGNIGGGGFIVFRPAAGEPAAYDFREMAPAAATPTMFLTDGKYDPAKHHDSYLSVGVPGTVAGLHLAWKEPRQAAVEAAGRAGHRAGPRRVPAERVPGRARSPGCCRRWRGTRPRSRSSRSTACRTSPVRCSCSRISPAR